jgi:post-segregation antitoxin (ccd killing protein)
MTQDRKSTCLYISREVLETARRSGLNLSRVSENALIEAIGRLQGPEARNGPAAASGRLVRGVGFGPTNPCGIAASGLRL